MSWREIYAAKLKTPEEAVKIIHSGDTVLIAHAAAEPDGLVSAMVDYVVEQDLRDIHLVQQHDMGTCKFFEPGMEKHFRYSSLLSELAAEIMLQRVREITCRYFLTVFLIM